MYGHFVRTESDKGSFRLLGHRVPTVSAVVLDGVCRHRLHTPRVILCGEDRRAAGVVDARDAAEVVSPFNYESITMCRAVFLAAFHYGEVQLHPDYLSLLGFHHESLSFVIYDGH